MAPKRLMAGLLVLLLSACNLPSLPNTSSRTSTPPSPTHTPGKTHTQAASPTETPSPTPSAEVRIKTADQELFDGDYVQAQSEYQIALSEATEAGTQMAALWGLGLVEYAAGNNAKALQDLSNLANNYPGTVNSTRAYFLMGKIYMTQERYTDAAQAFSVYLALRPHILDSYVQEQRGDAFAAAKNYPEAIAAYQAALEAPRINDNSAIEIKIAEAYAGSGDYATAITKYDELFSATTNDYFKAQLDLLAGQAYLAMGQAEKAYERFLHTVDNYPLAYDSYSALVALVNAGVTVDDLHRGLVDYYAGQYGYALDAFQRYITAGLDEDGTATFYRANTLLKMGNYQGGVDELANFISQYPSNSNWRSAWGTKADTEWFELDKYEEAAQTLLDYAAKDPDVMFAPQSLFSAGRIYERAGRLDDAARVWESIAEQYPGSELVPQALFQAGIVRLRNNQKEQALLTFQRDLLLSSSIEDQGRAAFWVGKLEQSLGHAAEAQSAWQQAASLDSTSYYNLRAQELLRNKPPFEVSPTLDLKVDWDAERREAEAWMRVTFNLPAETNLDLPGTLLEDSRLIQGAEFWSMGFKDEARLEFEDLRASIQKDPVQCFQLTNYLLELGLYRTAIFTARQVLTLAGETTQSQTLAAPRFFNHVRYGLYYQDIVLPAAQQNGFDPLFMYSVIRQESLFEGFVQSAAGARGLMQIVPSTGEEIAKNLGWPPDFTPDQLYRPYVSINLGTGYMMLNRNRFNGNLFATLAAYNAGAASAEAWLALSGEDQDLFLETIRFSETENYIRSIYENYNMYRLLYGFVP